MNNETFKNDRVKDKKPKNEKRRNYQPPRIIVHDADEFIKSLGPAQACSPSPMPE